MERNLGMLGWYKMKEELRDYGLELNKWKWKGWLDEMWSNEKMEFELPNWLDGTMLYSIVLSIPLHSLWRELTNWNSTVSCWIDWAWDEMNGKWRKG
jgi:hypothetical protein